MLRTIGKTRLLLSLSLALSGGCFVDKDNPCDANQVHLEGHVEGCVCAPNSIIDADGAGCTPCGENQEIKSGKCECKSGFALIAGVCQESALGSSCSVEMPCAAAYPYCSPMGYCTSSGCTSNADCTSGYFCDKSQGTAFCSLNPTGLGNACTTSADCASFEASRCATGTCQVGGCAAASGPRCIAEYACCDFTPLAPSVGDICVPTSSLMAGKCPATNADPVVRP